MSVNIIYSPPPLFLPVTGQHKCITNGSSCSMFCRLVDSWCVKHISDFTLALHHCFHVIQRQDSRKTVMIPTKEGRQGRQFDRARAPKSRPPPTSGGRFLRKCKECEPCVIQGRWKSRKSREAERIGLVRYSRHAY